MDFQQIANAFYSSTCIMSVKRSGDNGYSDVCIAAVNDKCAEYLSSQRGAGSDAGVLTIAPGTPYYEYFPQSRNFEDAVYRAAILKHEVHTYAYLNNLDVWVDIYAMPLEQEDGDTCYCVYTVNSDNNADSVLDTFNRSSVDVLKTCVKLHKADNINDAMKNVIGEIRSICDAEGCTVLLMNYDEEEYSIMATNYVEGSPIKRVTQFKDFYRIADSWEKMIGEAGDCALIKDEEDMEYYDKLNHPWVETLIEAGVRSVVLFPLRQGRELLGYIWATNFDTDKAMRIKEMMELTTFFVSAHIARYKAINRLHHMSYTDALTGLPNRFACTEHISEHVERGEKFAVVCVDLNHFKSINDTLGFEAGNCVLIETAERLKAVAGKIHSEADDHIARISADEFYLVIEDYDTDDELRAMIDKYVDALGRKLTVDGCDLYVTASFGYAEYPTDADNADSLISHANAAMNEIKKARNSQHVLRFSSDLLEDEHILEIERMIRTALEQDTLYFQLQPQYDMDHRLRGFEALARMRDDKGNNIPPGEFIPVAEKVGLIDSVDGTVFRKAALFFGEMIKETGADLILSINASVRHLMKNDFPDEIRNLLKISGIPADKLEVEITESIMIDSVDKALKCIDEIKEIGIHIAIDDFGTGYSSLSYLNRFPADLLKIDKSFIDEMDMSESSRQYVATIISIGHIMGFDVISEGVEDDGQLDTLKSIGCDYVQGFVWGRPLSAEDAAELIRSASYPAT
ncbi:diguanylate cyclase (GGDEF) domain-containing protein [Lachnospiraceae bacterium XBB2008]|nr:diguanylate cyclase (GGDEF) domain-containing protein [Lachnospiraceae bacterium XBB2008]